MQEEATRTQQTTRRWKSVKEGLGRNALIYRREYCGRRVRKLKSWIRNGKKGRSTAPSSSQVQIIGKDGKENDKNGRHSSIRIVLEAARFSKGREYVKRCTTSLIWRNPRRNGRISPCSDLGPGKKTGRRSDPVRVKLL